MPVRGLEPRAPFTEIDLARDSRIDHPLQSPVDGRATDLRVLAADALDELVGAEMAFLPQKDRENPIALGGALAAWGTERGEVGELAIHLVNW